MAAPTLPVQILLGIYLGVLTGILPALVVWALAFTFKYVTGLTVPSFAVVVLGVAMAGVNGGFLAFNDPSVLQSSNSVVVITAILVVMLVGFYAHNMGDTLGATIPRVTLRGLRERTLSADVVEYVEGRNRVRVSVVGAVEDMEGYPPLSPELRASISETVREWTFPADQPLPALETAVADRLREEFDLSDVVVTLDERARATVVAAPPFSGVSKAVPDGHRAVSIEGLVPAGVAPGETVTVVASDSDGTHRTTGSLLGARTAETSSSPPAVGPPTTDGGETGASTEPAGEPHGAHAPAPGGRGRLTVAVPRDDAAAVLGARSGAVVVTARGTRREYELLSLLRRSGQRVRRVTVVEGGPLAATTLGEASVRDRYGVVVLAVRHDGTWQFAPHGETPVSAGDTLFVAGTRDALGSLEEVAR